MMLKWVGSSFFIVCLLCGCIVDQCVGGSHLIAGPLTQTHFGGFTFLEKTLFKRNSTESRTYNVRFKYVGDSIVTFIHNGTIQSSAQNTRGNGSLYNGADIHDDSYFNAEIYIPDATNFDVNVSLRGEAVPRPAADGSLYWMRLKIFPRCYAIMCAIDEKRPLTTYRQFSFGDREHGDSIIHARHHRFASMDNQLPRHKIEFLDNNAVLTSVLIRLNSTKAIVFHNKVELTKHRFSATIYGLDRDSIADTVIIYGHQT